MYSLPVNNNQRFFLSILYQTGIAVSSLPSNRFKVFSYDGSLPFELDFDFLVTASFSALTVTDVSD